jgi:hypothetical protein
MKPLLITFISLTFSLKAIGQSRIDSVEIIHKILQGRWVDTISSTEFDYMNFDSSKVSDYLIITAGPNKNTGPTTEPGGFYYTYVITKQACFSDTIKTQKGGTGCFLKLMDETPTIQGRIYTICFNIKSIDNSSVILYRGSGTGAIFKKIIDK